MALRIITILTEDVDGVLEKFSDEKDIVELWAGTKRKGHMNELNMLVAAENLQELLDKIQRYFGKKKHWRMVVSPVETTIPRYEEPGDDDPKAKKSYGGMTREALYDQILKGTNINPDFIMLVVLSTIVTAIGLVTSNVAVIIGAMVIAPLLGPNLALSFGVTLGDKPMITEAFKANLVGVGLTMLLSITIGLFVPYDVITESQEYVSRTSVGYVGIALALASGAAAVLSLTAGISTTMVGVMVAVALMPPAVALGMAIGCGAFAEAFGATLLLSINVICVNIAAKIVFAIKGIRPRTWYKRKKSEQSLRMSLLIWGALLIILTGLIYIWQQY
jgi:uncharacterized hydrophobic protein (TIGR00341 family)